MENERGIVICIGSDELKRATLKAAVEACDAIMADVDVMSGIVHRTNIIDHYNRYNLEMIRYDFKMETKHEHETYGWYRKFEKKRF